ncbi:MAG: LacI family transcriptional regulator [Opitutaceae bacterium]|jgi:LacI family transcriptional regulator|nr:LacI family transcriptional regulator [Opitutaceae bacterium]
MPKQTASAERVTVRHIAELAGVSVGSVSTVLNNHQVERRISEGTVKRIREAAAKLGYLPNIGARRLRSKGGGKPPVVLAIVTSYEAPIPLISHFITALRRRVKDHEQHSQYLFSVMIEMFSAGRLRETQGLLSGDLFNAAIILNTTPEDDQFLRHNRVACPVVLVNRAIAGYPSVTEDMAGGAKAADILIRGKSKRLVVLHGSPLTQITKGRVDSFMRRAAETLGCPAVEAVADDLSEDAGYRAVKSLLKKGSEADGLYAVSDPLALGAYRAIRETGRSIPNGISVVGTGDYDISAFFDPPLTCVGVSHKELAEAAVASLLRQLGRGAAAETGKVVPVRELARASVRKA